MADPVANVVVSMPSQLFTRPEVFSAVSNGKIFIGRPDTDPTVVGNQIQVYIEGESGDLTAISQPLRTNTGGYPVYNGQIVKFVTVQNYSMTVQSSTGVQLFYFPDLLKYSPDQFGPDLLLQLSQTGPYANNDSKGDGMIGVKQPFAGAVLRTQHDKNAEYVSVKDFGAKGDGVTDDTVAIMAAFSCGKNVKIPAGNYIISKLIYPGHNGQTIEGDGQDNTFITNNINNEPLFMFGNPSSSTGTKQWCTVKYITFQGNPSGTTLWGVFSANAPLVNGTPNISGQYEGVSTSSNNYYFGKTTFPLTDWEIAGRGNSLQSVDIFNVYGGYALHVSSWDFYASKVKLWSGKQGLRNSGAANSNHFVDLYISAMGYEGIIEPDVTSTIPTACQYDNCIVQQCGVGLIGGHASIELYKGQSTIINSLYLEKNNERGGATDIYVGVAAIGNVINGVRHRVDTGTTLPTIIENHGQGTMIENVVYGSDVAAVVLNAGTDSRTSCVVGLLVSAGGTATAEISDTSTGKKVLMRDVVGRFVSLGSYTDGAFSTTTGLHITQGSSSSRKLEVASNGNMTFIIDQSNVSTGRTFLFGHNGKDGTETSLVEISDLSYIYPGAANTGLLGTSTRPFSSGYVQTAIQVTSDGRQKEQERSLNDAEIAVAVKIRKSVKLYKLKDSVSDKGDSARMHCGVIAQEVIAAFDSEGLDYGDYGVVCHDFCEYSPAIYSEDGELVKAEVEAVDKYTVRYEELLCFMISSV